MSHTAFELQDLVRRGPQVCPVCRLVEREMRRHVDRLFFDRVNDIPTRERIRASGGFCRRHTRLILRQADALGTAIIYRDVLSHTLDEVRNMGCGRSSGGEGNLLSRFIGGARPNDSRAPCPLDEVEEEMEKRTVDSLFEAMAQPQFFELFQQSAGLCLPHYCLASERCKDAEIWSHIVETQERAMTGLIEELAALARSYDHHQKVKPIGEQATSWRRALNVSVGLLDE